MTFNTAKTQRRRSSKLKAGAAPSLEDNSEIGPEIVAHVGTGDSSNNVMGSVRTCESVTNVLTLAQDAGSDGDSAMVAVPREPEKLNSESSLTHIPSLDDERQMHDKPTPNRKQKLIAAKLLKKNGIATDMVETRALVNSESAVGQDFCQINNGKPNHVEESTDLTTSVQISSRKRRAPVLNGYHRSVTVSTRRRSTLQENSQTLNVTANKLETAVNGDIADTVTALLEELSDTKDLELVNGKELVVDSN